MAETATTCCYCGVGCGVLVDVEGGKLKGVRGDPAHPANFGKLCTKGLSLAQYRLGGRLLHPEVHGKRSSWDEALDLVAGKIADSVAKHGPDAIGLYVSGQLLTEDYYVFNKLAKGLLGTNNIDTNSRLCMSSAVAGYKKTLGADAPPACYEDLDHADLLFIAGSNTAWAHPVLFRRIEEARVRRPHMKMIVVDPRRTETAREADLHLQILPGTDVALFHGMLQVMLWEGLVDEAYIAAHTTGFEILRNAVREFTPKAVAATCGIEEARVVEAARLFATSPATLSLYCQGLNQSASGTAKNAALIHLHLATGQIGRPGAGPFSLTGQPNAMGGREVGGLANLLSAHRELGNAAHRAEVAKFWGVADVPARPGKTAVEMFEAVRAGEIKVLWIVCTNPAQSLPDQALVREALQRAELVIVQEAYRTTETAAFAHVLLPATSWGEKEGTVTNSERRISRVRAALPAPGEARPDWQIAVEVARRISPEGQRLFPYETPESVFNEHRESTRGRDLDITGMSYALLDAKGPQQWPFPEGATAGKARLYEDGVYPTPDGKARFTAIAYRPVAENIDARHPLRLTTGRLRDQWHAMSRTGTVASLFAHSPEPRIALHPSDLDRAGLKDGALVRVSSRRGVIHVMAEASSELRPGVAFLPMHWGARFLGGREAGGVNELTLPRLDPDSKQPELKHCAIRVERADLGWRLVAFGSIPEGADALIERLDPFMAQFDFASRVPSAEGVLLRLACREAPAPEILHALDAVFALEGAETLRYDDASRAMGRRIALDGDRIRAVRLSGDTRSERWIHERWVRNASIAEVRRYLAMPLAAPPGVIAGVRKMVCVCHNVTEDAIVEAIGKGEHSLPLLQASLKCGTNCGSCIPEVRGLLRAKAAAA